MLFFSLKGETKEPLVLKDQNGNPMLQINVIPSDVEHANAHFIYAASIFDVRQIAFLINQKFGDSVQLQIFDNEVIESGFDLPKKLGVHVGKDGKDNQYGLLEHISQWEKELKKEVKILFCQSFGNSFTDAYVSSNILRSISEKFISKGIAVNIDGTLSNAFPQPGMILNNIHPLNSYMPSILPLTKLLEYDAYWSFSDPEVREGYEVEDHFEFFSRQYGLEETIRRNDFYIDKVSRIQINNALNKMMENHEELAIIQLNGTLQLHQMPDSLAKDFLENTCKENKNTIFVSDVIFDLELDNLLHLPKVSTNFLDYVILIENADKVLTVSSLTPLLAKELNVPCLYISTMSDGNKILSLDNNSIIETISLIDHEYYDTENLYMPADNSILESIWKDMDAEQLKEAFNGLNKKEKRKEFDSNIKTGRELIAELMNPNYTNE